MAEKVIDEALERKYYAAPSLLEKETAGVRGSGCRSSFLAVIQVACEISDFANRTYDVEAPIQTQRHLDDKFERALFLFNKCLQDNAKDWYVRAKETGGPF